MEQLIPIKGLRNIVNDYLKYPLKFEYELLDTTKNIYNEMMYHNIYYYGKKVKSNRFGQHREGNDYRFTRRIINNLGIWEINVRGYNFTLIPS